jgi:flagellar hook-associated protein 2
MPLVNFSGIASGIDTQALLQATVDAQRKLRVEPLETKINELEETNDAIKEIKERLEKFRTNALDFTTLNGGGVAKLAQATDETVLTATATNSANNGTYTLSVAQLATTATFSFDDRFATSTSAAAPSIDDGQPDSARTVTFTVGTGTNQETVALVLTSTTTVSDIVANFNANSTKAQAALVNVGTTAVPSYAITISSLNQGTELGELGISLGSEFTTTGNLNTSTLNQAQNAQFSLSGISGTIERSSNTVNDIVNGVTFELSGTGTSTITVGEDTETTKTSIRQLVDSYNDIVQYFNENDTITREEDGDEVTNIYGSLARTNIDDDTLASLRSEIASALATNGTAVRIFADLGITTERDGTLAFDEDDFDSAIAAEPNSVNELLRNFADSTVTTGGTLSQFTQFNGVIDLTVTSNQNQIRDLNERIGDAEGFIARTEAALQARFARLESLIGSLQGQQNALVSALAGLNAGG